MSFEVGDRVKCIAKDKDDLDMDIEGKLGEVTEAYATYATVRFDHNINGHVDDPRCYCVENSSLEHVEEAMFKVGDIVEFEQRGDEYEIEYVGSNINDEVIYVFKGTEGMINIGGRGLTLVKSADEPTFQEIMKASTAAIAKAASERQTGGNHYKDLKIEPIEYALANKLDFAQGSIIKYVTRFRAKNGIEDLRKAIHCIELLIEFEEKK